MTLSLELASRICAFDSSRAAPEVLEAARTAVTDTLAVTVLGASDPATQILERTPGLADGEGPCVVVGTPLKRSLLDAALLNGVASHAHDFDDFTQEFGGHPSVPVLPGLLALADARTFSGRNLLHAFIVGVEAETRIASGVHFHHYEKGWHPTATLGVFGAASACAYVMGLNDQQTATALCIAASLASGVKANFGTMTKPLHVGHCARNGLLAALLAEAGFSANLAAFEAPQGFLNVFNGPGRYDVDRMLDPWFDPPLVLEPGISIKQFPCCGSTHPAIYAALGLRRDHDIDSGDISEIEIRTHPLRLPHTDNPMPESPLQAKFSIQYCVARALSSGNVSLSDFGQEQIRDPETRRLMGSTAVVPDAAFAGSKHRAFGASVAVGLNDGRRLKGEVAQRAGRGRDDPMSTEELKAKFDDCTRNALPEARAAALWALLGGLEQVPEAGQLTRALAVEMPRSRAVAG
jgi:2-methylcitrate dehydratase PrpD